MATRGERGTLVISLDALNRMSANPFYPYMMERIGEGMGRGRKPGLPPPADAAAKATPTGAPVPEGAVK
jgi:hypothetical protein